MTEKSSFLKQLQTDSHIYQILRDLDSHGYEAYVAGGYCRDTYMGRPYRDIDIFVKVNSSTIDDVSIGVLSYFDKMHLALYSSNNLDYADNPTFEVFEQYTFEYQDLPLNIIFRNFDTLENLLDTFNFGINMIGMSKYRWHFTPKFLYDVTREVITLYKPDDPSNEDRLTALKEKYPWPSVPFQELSDVQLLEYSQNIVKDVNKNIEMLTA